MLGGTEHRKHLAPSFFNVAGPPERFLFFDNDYFNTSQPGRFWPTCHHRIIASSSHGIEALLRGQVWRTQTTHRWAARSHFSEEGLSGCGDSLKGF